NGGVDRRDPGAGGVGRRDGERGRDKDAGELRGKEADRISTVGDNLKGGGVRAVETGNGMMIPGEQKFKTAEVEGFWGHRIAMAFAVAALSADGECTIDCADAASVRLPRVLEHVGGGGR